MFRNWQYRLLSALGALALALVLANGALFLLNREAQAEVGTRQQFIQQSVQLETLYREIVKALAELAVKNNDSQVMQMLASQGINVSVTAPAASAAGGAASGARK